MSKEWIGQSGFSYFFVLFFVGNVQEVGRQVGFFSSPNPLDSLVSL